MTGPSCFLSAKQGGKKLDTKEKYKDIIHAQRPPVPEKHPRMTLLNRAKIFSPFAALRGYDEKIDEQNVKKSGSQDTRFK